MTYAYSCFFIFRYPDQLFKRRNNMLGNCIENVRKKVPLVHNITNYVTVNDVANVLLACGGSPIMSDEPEDVADITSICGGLNINIGTLNKRSIEGMFIAGKKANELGHIVLLDPVGAGASALRTGTAVELMEKIKFNVIRGNISEIKTLALGSGTTKGVDADVADAVTDDNLDKSIAFVKELAAKTGTGVIIIGNNKGWKQNVNLGNRTNQNFVSIPHLTLIRMIRYKAALRGIEVRIVEDIQKPHHRRHL